MEAEQERIENMARNHIVPENIPEKFRRREGAGGQQT